MCVCTKPGMTAQPAASITVSAVCPLPPISAMRVPVMRRSARTMELCWSIVTSVPFLMRIEDMQDSLRHKKAQEIQNDWIKPNYLYFLCLLEAKATSWRSSHWLLQALPEPADRA